MPASAATNGRSLFGNANSGKCLEMPYSWTHDLAPAGQFSCHGGINQQWNMATLDRPHPEPLQRQMP